VTCLTCGNLILDPNIVYGYAGPVCYCSVPPKIQRPAALTELAKAPKDAREWWVTEYKNGDVRAFDRPIHPELEGWIIKETHVVEMSALTQAQAEIEDLKQSLEATRADRRLLDDCNIKLDAENARLREALEIYSKWHHCDVENIARKALESNGFN
jgi:hypothetical protein